MITEEHVLKNCMHNSDKVLEDVFFPKFKDEFEEVKAAVPNGYYSAIVHRTPITFGEWKKIRYKEFREARYLPISEQLDMRFHDEINGTLNWMEHVESVKAKYPKQ